MGQHILCDIFDGVSIRRHTKIYGDVRIDKPNFSITSMMQPRWIIPWMKADSELSGLWNHFQIFAPFADFKTCDEVENSYDKTCHVFSQTLEVTCSDEILGWTGTACTFSEQAKSALKEHFESKSQEC